MKKIVLFVALGIVGVSTFGNFTSVFADEAQTEQVTLLDLEPENSIDMFNPAAHIIQKRDNMDVQGVYWGGKRPSQRQIDSCRKGTALGALGGVTGGVLGAAWGAFVGALGSCG